MEVVTLIIHIILIVLSVTLIALVLMQQGKAMPWTGGASQIDGSFWSTAKGRSKEGRLHTLTTALFVTWIVLCILANFFVR